MKISWYFDFISPFAYLQLCQFNRLPNNIEVEYKPILLAGLLKHWNNVGPAEVEPKRIFTYQHCYWHARTNNIPYKMPPAHPFNSLLPLRLAIALDCQANVIKTIFNSIWQHGQDINSAEAISHLQQQLNIDNLIHLTTEPAVKQQLISNTENAASKGIFGVPTFSLKDNKGSLENFWGLDAFDMLLDYLTDSESFNDAEMLRVKKLPVGIQRKKA